MSVTLWAETGIRTLSSRVTLTSDVSDQKSTLYQALRMYRLSNSVTLGSVGFELSQRKEIRSYILTEDRYRGNSHYTAWASITRYATVHAVQGLCKQMELA